MTTISIVRDRGPATHFATVYRLSDLNPSLVGDFSFEILERDGAALEVHIGQKHYLTADGGQPFWGELTSLVLCASTVAGLAMMRDRPALRGVIRILPDAAGVAQ